MNSTQSAIGLSTGGTSWDQLRGLVAEAVREAVAELTSATPDHGSSPPSPAAAPTTVEPDNRPVVLRDDADLARFVRLLLDLTATPEGRAALDDRRIRFRLDNGDPARGGSAEPSPAQRVHRIERGAVGEAVVTAAAAAGQHIVAGPRAVITPLGRDTARRLGIRIDREGA
ncbi:hypothetical protein [Embleya scabrispora]|uniref:hypothetical protein n=1 Tax=Embleya scabrispora TaxID=159449 RepID=UPI000373DE29|nr:hypothetical protein [Embleya scabrispora]MYS86650.1 hypothetical protein [Streptomyces sp. SID5474]